MRVVMLSKALVVGAYQKKAEEIARLGVDLTVLVPPMWRDRRGESYLSKVHVDGYRLQALPMLLNGSYHLHFYPTFSARLGQLRPDLVHVDEEPYNLATWLALRAAQRRGALGTFFTWQNIEKRYPPPFRFFERAAYERCPAAIAGSEEAAGVLRRKGYRGEVAVIPQFGVDPESFSPGPDLPTTPFEVGYAGGFLPEKGIDLIFRALATFDGQWRLSLVGSGSEKTRLTELAADLGIVDRVRFLGRRASDEMADFYRSLHVLVVPSRTLPNWKEQFGRVIIEAMACGVAVVGSDSGEIPRVVGEAGLIFPEGDVAALRQALHRLQQGPALAGHLGALGRRRVLSEFTMARIAAATVGVYRRLLANR